MEDAVPVSEIMTREYLGVSESDPLDEAVALMREEGVSAVVVQRGTEPVGMLTAADALALVGDDRDPARTAVGDLMSGTVPAVDPGAPVIRAAGEMADAGIGSLLVIDDDEVVGVVSERDVVRAMSTLADHATVADPVALEDAPPAATATTAESGATGTVDEYGANPTEGEYATQSVCEICGSLDPDLHEFNGQLICGDCREI